MTLDNVTSKHRSCAIAEVTYMLRIKISSVSCSWRLSAGVGLPLLFNKRQRSFLHYTTCAYETCADLVQEESPMG